MAEAGQAWLEVGKKKKKMKNGAGRLVREKGQEKRSLKILEACEVQDLNDLESFQNFFTPLAKQTFLGGSTPRSQQVYRFSLDPFSGSSPPSDESLKSSSVRGSTPLSELKSKPTDTCGPTPHSDLSLKCLEPCGSTPRSAVGRRPVVDIVSGELGRSRSAFRVASPVSHCTLHPKSLTSVPRVCASPSPLARVRASASSLCCACCGVASVGGGRTLCGSCLLVALGGVDTHNSCLVHGHDVLGEQRHRVRVLGLGFGDPSKVLCQLRTKWHWVIEGSQKCMSRRGRVALALTGVGQGWWNWSKGAK